jgi:hypothetical protein
MTVLSALANTIRKASSSRGPRRPKPSQSLSSPSQTSVYRQKFLRLLSRRHYAEDAVVDGSFSFALAIATGCGFRGPRQNHRSRYPVHRRPPYRQFRHKASLTPRTRLSTVLSHSSIARLWFRGLVDQNHRSRYPVHRRPPVLAVPSTQGVTTPRTQLSTVLSHCHRHTGWFWRPRRPNHRSRAIQSIADFRTGSSSTQGVTTPRTRSCRRLFRTRHRHRLWLEALVDRAKPSQSLSSPSQTSALAVPSTQGVTTPEDAVVDGSFALRH